MKKYWFIPGIVAVAVYAVAINNFFVADDFIWLYRAKTLTNNPAQMLNPDVMYFDPLVYLSFLANYKFGGIDPKYYHLVDLLMHAINATLVYRFAKNLSKDTKAGLYAGVMFASSFAIADAVLWPSSRVDLIAVMCSLGALIQFLKYLESNKLMLLHLSCLLFALALAAKGTPVVLPIVLLWLAVNKDKPLRTVASVLPYGLLIVIFFVLLKLQLHHVSIFHSKHYLNLHNLSLSLCALFLPDRYLEAMNLAVFTPLLAIAILLVGFLKFLPDHPISLRRTGAIVLFCSILPMLVLGDFKISTPDQDAIALLASPSHRIYQASIGSALLIGGTLRSVEALIGRFSSKFAPGIIAIFIVGMVLFNASEVAKRDHQWEDAGKLGRAALDGLLASRNMLVEGGQTVLVNFPASKGFNASMIKVYFDLNDITVLPRRSSIMVLDPPDILKNHEKSSLFIFGADNRVYDFSDQFRLKLLCNMQMLSGHDEVDLISRKCERMTTALNEQIAALIQ